MTRLILPRDLRARIEAGAREAFPRECCGLVEGVRIGGAVVVTAVHAVLNLAERPDAFEIDPAAHFKLLHATRGTDKQVVGCYHSHPNGKPEPSEKDRACAVEAGFLWLIAALTASDAPIAVRAFLFESRDFVAVPIIATASLDPVLRPRV